MGNAIDWFWQQVQDLDIDVTIRGGDGDVVATTEGATGRPSVTWDTGWSQGRLGDLQVSRGVAMLGGALLLLLLVR